MKTDTRYALKVGAGAHEIVFPDAMFPVEGFNGHVHINPFVRVLLLEQRTKIAIVSYEMVNVPSDVIAQVKTIVSEKTDTSVHHVWVHATHAITTPHAPDNTVKRSLFVDAMVNAAATAAERAAATFQPAELGVATGNCNVNANRDITIGENWYYGLGSTMPSNKKMTVLCFRGLDGNAIGFFISYGIKPTAIDNVEMDTVTRKISSDVPGIACRMMEAEFHVPSLFCMPAAGDQIPRETAMYWEADKAGQAVEIKRTVAEGIEIVERLGREMGNAALAIANSITDFTDEEQPIISADTSFTWPNKNGDGEVTTAVRGIAVGNDLAFVGLKPEINALTEMELLDVSPYKHTLILSFLDGDSKYMPDKHSHDLQTWEWKRSGTAKGSAEKFVETAANLLNRIRAGETIDDTEPHPESENNSIVEKTRVRMGGIDWIVLDKQDDKTLVVSAKILEKRAYHSPGGAITWENSEIRTYLNREFIDKTFTAQEKGTIVETCIENKSNSQYGVAGGNATIDRVFLLSLAEAEKYFSGGVELLRGIDIESDEVVWWHLRSPGEAADVAASVNAIGLIDYHGVFSGVTDPTGGVRPAMWVTGLPD